MRINTMTIGYLGSEERANTNKELMRKIIKPEKNIG